MDVDTANRRDVWLVKVPKYLANAWLKAPPRADLGKIRVSKDQSGKVEFVTDPKLSASSTSTSGTAGSTNDALPSEHSLTLKPVTNQSMVILAQNIDNKSAAPNSINTSSSSTFDKISFEGDIKYRGELRPKADRSYLSLKASTIREATKPVRTAQILDKAPTAYKPRSAAQLAHEADLRKKKEEAKRTVREDKEIVQGRLFAAFEKKQFYNIKDLVKLTNQSIPYLKEILKEICNYCSSGTNKNMWELKPEYRHYKSTN